jgi:malonyl-CoA decarboxylase
VVYEIQEELPHIKNFGTLSPIPGFADWFTYLDETKIKNILGDLKDQDAIFLKSQDLKLGDSRIIKNKEAITKLVAHYIVNEKNKKDYQLMMLVDFI